VLLFKTPVLFSRKKWQTAIWAHLRATHNNLVSTVDKVSPKFKVLPSPPSPCCLLTFVGRSSPVLKLFFFITYPLVSALQHSFFAALWVSYIILCFSFCGLLVLREAKCQFVFSLLSHTTYNFSNTLRFCTCQSAFITLVGKKASTMLAGHTIVRVTHRADAGQGLNIVSVMLKSGQLAAMRKCKKNKTKKRWSPSFKLYYSRVILGQSLKKGKKKTFQSSTRRYVPGLESVQASILWYVWLI